MFRPFLSVDAESTGLPSENPQVLEIAMIFDDMGMSGSLVKETLHLYIDHGDKELNWSDKALEIHQESGLLKKIKKLKEEGDERMVSPEKARELIAEFVQRVSSDYNGGYPLTVAGKLCAKVTFPLLEAGGFVCEGLGPKTLDVPSLYFLEFQYLPSLYEIKKRMNVRGDGSCLSDTQVINELVNLKINREIGM